MAVEQNKMGQSNIDENRYILEGTDIAALNSVLIMKHSAGPIDTEVKGFFDLHPQHIEIDLAVFSNTTSSTSFPQVEVQQRPNTLILSCQCNTGSNKLCEHQAQVLYNIIKHEDLRIFFDKKLRHEKIKLIAADYGLDHEQEPDQLFEIVHSQRAIEIVPKQKELLPVTKDKNTALKSLLLPQQGLQLNRPTEDDGITKVIVLKQHRYYNHFQIELFEAATTQNGKIKNPMNLIDPLDLIWKIENTEELKFYSAISKFQNNYDPGKSHNDIAGLNALVKNPLHLPVFYHDPKVSVNITSNSIIPVKLKRLDVDISLFVDLKNDYYEVYGQLLLDGKAYELKLLNIKYNYFILYNNVMYLIGNADHLRVIEYFKQNNNKIVIHRSKFDEFREDILSKLENSIRVTYSYLKPATKEQLEENNFDKETERMIYLSDSDEFVLITPVVRYGNVEVPALSKKQIQAADILGNVFTVDRDIDAELQFISNIQRQHPTFEEQAGQDCFHLHKKRFLHEGWFLEAFAEWQERGILVLGFNELKNNNINPNRAKISILVNSGLNWFETQLDVKFGQQKVSLKHLHRSIRNKNKFVQLGDGTLGLLPEEWIEKLSKFFHSGEVVEESIRTPKVNFSEISELYADEVLSEEVKMQLKVFKSKISNFENIEETVVPEDLNATLRSYQKQGLSWLNFLDEFNFGGCLADDMGLGKTIQIIAFILSQRNKGHHNTNLIVVPTTLIFNWKAEIEKFAPSIKVHTIYGAERVKNTHVFDEYEVILTSYGTLLYDVHFLKKYHFNYIFLDESQTIKNPASLRYQAVRLLQSRNKIVITGTPIENNTFDLYGQLSFACPGLLGDQQYFKDQYAIPIDKFKNTKKAIQLQKKVSPFILRRTKKEVATELPEKTEMVIYCEMGEEQKRVYETCRREFKDFILSKKEDDLLLQRMHVLKCLTQLRQICNSPALLKDDLLHGTSSSKIQTLMEEIENRAPQHKILVFSQFVSMLDLIKKELKSRNIGFEYLTGQTRNRASKVEEFQNNDDVRVFLISLKAGGTGLNLTEADYVYLVDPWWNPAVENQAIDRCYRIGQKKNIVAVRLICPDTVEEKIMQLQRTKRDLVNNLIKTDGSILKSFSKKDLLELFS